MGTIGENRPFRRVRITLHVDVDGYVELPGLAALAIGGLEQHPDVQKITEVEVSLERKTPE